VRERAAGRGLAATRGSEQAAREWAQPRASHVSGRSRARGPEVTRHPIGVYSTGGALRATPSTASKRRSTCRSWLRCGPTPGPPPRCCFGAKRKSASDDRRRPPEGLAYVVLWVVLPRERRRRRRSGSPRSASPGVRSTPSSCIGSAPTSRRSGDRPHVARRLGLAGHARLGRFLDAADPCAPV
jgi:hypothetical protein